MPVSSPGALRKPPADDELDPLQAVVTHAPHPVQPPRGGGHQVRVEQRARQRRAELHALDAHRAVDAVAALVGVVGAGVDHARPRPGAGAGRRRSPTAAPPWTRSGWRTCSRKAPRQAQALGVGEVEVRLLDVGAHVARSAPTAAPRPAAGGWAGRTTRGRCRWRGPSGRRGARRRRRSPRSARGRCARPSRRRPRRSATASPRPCAARRTCAGRCSRRCACPRRPATTARASRPAGCRPRPSPGSPGRRGGSAASARGTRPLAISASSFPPRRRRRPTSASAARPSRSTQV